MFKIFQRRPKITFKTAIPGLEVLHPIVPASQFAGEFHSRAKNENRNGDPKATTKCIGIRDLFNKGFVQTTFCDIEVITNTNGMEFVYRTPVKVNNMYIDGLQSDLLGQHSYQQYFEFMGKPENTLNSIIKYNSPWTVHVPPGFYLLQAPLHHVGEYRFTTATGVLSGGLVIDLNVQLQWHITEGNTLIKAGTPIAHYQLIRKEDVEVECRAMTVEEGKIHRNIQQFRLRKFITQPEKMPAESNAVYTASQKKCPFHWKK
jgi:hypothetical protein